MTESKPSRAPTHRLYIVKETGDASRWVEIGAAWANRDGQGFSLQLDAAPIGGRLIMREVATENGGQS